MKAGYYDTMSMAQYLADPCDEPALSTTVAATLLNKTPMHARLVHPRMGNQSSGNSGRMDIGSAVHSLVLGGAQVQYVEKVTKRSGKEKGQEFEPDDWTTADAQEQRDAIRAAGNIPMLPNQRATLEAATANAKAHLHQDGKPEVTMLYQYEGVWLRGRCDWLSPGKDQELKTVDNADPLLFSRTLFTNSYDLQAAIRWMGHHVLTGAYKDFEWVLQEIDGAFATSQISPGNAMLELMERKLKIVCRKWRKCLDENRWPGYETTPFYVDPPSFQQWDLEAREGFAQ